MEPTTFLFHNHKFQPSHRPIVMADNRSFRYGDGCFETMKWLNGKVELANLHWERLFSTLDQLEFDVPARFTPDFLQASIDQLVKKNKHESGARIRLTVYRGEGGLHDAVSDLPRLLIQSWPLPLGHDQLNSNGLDIGLYSLSLKSIDTLSSLKTNQFLPYVLAAKWARKHHWNDALLCNHLGGIADSTIANLFLVKKGLLVTPSLSEGPVAGVMRQKVIWEANKLGWAVSEQRIRPEDLLAADEVFLTNSIHAIRWVKSFSGKAYSSDWTTQFWHQFRGSLG